MQSRYACAYAESVRPADAMPFRLASLVSLLLVEPEPLLVPDALPPDDVVPEPPPDVALPPLMLVEPPLGLCPLALLPGLDVVPPVVEPLLTPLPPLALCPLVLLPGLDIVPPVAEPDEVAPPESVPDVVPLVVPPDVPVDVPPEVPPLRLPPDVPVLLPVLGDADPDACASRLHASKSACVAVCANAADPAPRTAATVRTAVVRLNLFISRTSYGKPELDVALRLA